MKTYVSTLLPFLLSFYALELNGSNYIDYQKHFNTIDAAVKKNDLNYASSLLDSVNLKYTFVFSKHCMMALQICCRNNDSTRAAMWLRRCFLQGIPAWIVRQNEITKACIHYTNNNTITLH